MPARIPDKLFFKIGEVARLLAVRPSVLRYWETEFETLSPGKTGSGQRLYSRKDVELALGIKHLLYVEKVTIEGARRRINKKPKQAIEDDGDVYSLVLDEVKADLRSIRDTLLHRESKVKIGA